MDKIMNLSNNNPLRIHILRGLLCQGLIVFHITLYELRYLEMVKAHRIESNPIRCAFI